MSDLIDTTEMYLRTIFELMEEGVTPMRARIAERLHQSGPTVSQTVARMERDGLLRVTSDRHIELSETGFELAQAVMRKHRLAERLLTDVIGLEWELVHDEACRWEHVISDAVERRLLTVLATPTESPYGNPIPGLEKLGAPSAAEFRAGVEPIIDLVSGEEVVQLELVRMSENAQAQPDVLATFAAAGIYPGAKVSARATRTGLVLVGPTGEVELPFDLAERLFGRRVQP